MMVVVIVVFSLCAALSCFFVARATKKPPPQLDHIPRLEITGATTFKEKQDQYIKNSAELLREGYRKFGNKTYKLWTTDGDRVFVSKEVANILKSFPAEKLSSHEAVSEIFMGKYVGMHKRDKWGVDVIRSDLTQSLGKLAFDLEDEVVYACGTELQIGYHWTEVEIRPKILRMIALIAGRAFVGPTLNRNEDWINQMIDFTIDIFQGGQKLKEWNWMLRPIVQWFIPEMRRIREHHVKAARYLTPTIQARLDEETTNGYQKKNDAIQWLMDRSRKAKGNVDPKEMAYYQLLFSFAAIHTTNSAILQMLYDLAAMPEYMEPLREEITQAWDGAEGHLGRSTVMKLEKLDSFMKESQRLNPPGMVSFIRKVMEPIELGDWGHLPMGTIISVPNFALDYNSTETVWRDADQFNGFRYYEMRRSSPEQNSHHQFSETSLDAMYFGLGRQACPGRFFASNEIKLLLVHLIMNYDIGLSDSEKGRPANLHYETQVLADPAYKLSMRRRNPEDSCKPSGV